MESTQQTIPITFKPFSTEQELQWIMVTLRAQLSEPYSIFTYTYFITTWPELTIMSYHKDKIIGCIIGSYDTVNVRKAYIAMLVVSQDYRRAKVGKKLFHEFYNKVEKNVDKIVLETQCINVAALKFYIGLGFFKTRRMLNYYVSGNDAYRLKLYIREKSQPIEKDKGQQVKKVQNVQEEQKKTQ